MSSTHILASVAGTGAGAVPASLCLVIPTYNEAGNIGALLERIGAAMGQLGIAYQVVVVDDASTDGTAEVVERAAASDRRVQLLVRKDERGLASAVVRGWQRGDAGVLGVMDADLQHPPELLPQLWAKISEGADLALASRYLPDASLGEWNVGRRVLSVLGIWMTALVLPRGRKVSDPASGFFLVRRSALAGVALQPQGFKILLEVLVRGNVGAIAEVPFRFGVRRAGESKGNARVLLDYFALLWKLWRAGRNAGQPAVRPSGE